MALSSAWFKAHQTQLLAGGGIAAVGAGVLAARKKSGGQTTPTADTLPTDLMGAVQPQLDALADAERQQGGILAALQKQLAAQHKTPPTPKRVPKPPVPSRTFVITQSQLAAAIYASQVAAGQIHPVSASIAATRTPPRPAPPSKQSATASVAPAARNPYQGAPGGPHTPNVAPPRPRPAPTGAAAGGVAGSRVGRSINRRFF